MVPWGLFEYLKDELAVSLRISAFLFEGSIGILISKLRYRNAFIQYSYKVYANVYWVHNSNNIFLGK